VDEILSTEQATTPQRLSTAFLAKNKSSSFIFGRNVARVKMVP
jgi:hypothetical protein